MKSILNKNSDNSSIPPSKDEKTKKKKVNLREKTNKKNGGQKGHIFYYDKRKDHYTSLYNFGLKEKHVECNVH